MKYVRAKKGMPYGWKKNLFMLILLFISLPSAIIFLSSISSTSTEIPKDWKIPVITGNMLFTTVEPQDSRYHASVGNGYIATVIGNNIQYIAGIYNGRNSMDPSHRAKIPSSTSITITNAYITGSALDMQHGVFYRRSKLSSDDQVVIEQRWYAHRVSRNYIVHEIQVQTGRSNATLSLEINNKFGNRDINF